MELEVSTYLHTVGGILDYLWLELEFVEVFTLTFLSAMPLL